MITVTFQQGSPEWHAHRRSHFNASDAAAMLGISPYKTRTELLREYSTGITKEVDAGTQHRFNEGHRLEAAARHIAESYIGEELYPVTGVLEDTKLSASFDGLTMMENKAWEHKTLNADLRTYMRDGVTANDLPEFYRAQMQQQCLVSGCNYVLFTASNDEQVYHWEYKSDDAMAARILAGWSQFEKDLAEFQHQTAEPQAVGKAPDMLPALRIEVTGMVTASNLAEYKEAAIAVFKNISRDIKTDQDFANADKTVKWCKDIEERLAAAKQHALSQTASIDDLFRAIDSISEEARTTRLELDKLVKARKETIRAEIIQSGQSALAAHINAINDKLGKVRLPAIDADFAGAIKGKKSFDNMRDAVSDELAKAKIAADSQAAHIETSLSILRQHGADMPFLFADAQLLVMKAHDDLTAVIMQRIREHNEAAEKKSQDQKQQQQFTAEVAASVNAAHQVLGEKFSDAPVVKEFVQAVEQVGQIVGTNSGRPTQDEIIETLMLCYNQKRCVIIQWMREMDFHGENL